MTVPFRTKILEVMSALNISSASNINLYISNYGDAQINMCRRDSCRFLVDICRTYQNGYVNISRIPQLFYQRVSF